MAASGRAGQVGATLRRAEAVIPSSRAAGFMAIPLLRLDHNWSQTSGDNCTYVRPIATSQPNS